MTSEEEITRRVKGLVTKADGPLRIDLTLAGILGISRSSAVDRLSGRARWKASEVREVAAHYGVSSAALLDKDAPEPEPKGLRFEFPVLGRVSASPARDDVFETELRTLPADLAAFEVKDASMAPVIMPGHTVFFSESAEVEEGDVVIAESTEGRMLRRYYSEGSKVVLNSLDAKYPPVVLPRRSVRLYKVVGACFI